MSQDCPTKLISDLPAESDAFGSHWRVAEALATLLEDEEGGKAIALSGSWGSGKSTVIKFLTKLLNKTDDSATPRKEIFVFDAWAHHGDPLRRAFLETLIQFLVDRNWIDANKWEDELDKVTRRREDTDTTSTPILTWPGRIMAFCALLLPLGYTLFGKYDSDAELFGQPVGNIGLIVSLSPLLVAALTWLALRPSLKVWTKHFWCEHREPYQGESIVSFFIQKTRETNRSTTIRTLDPTSIEFRVIFFKVLAEAIGQPDRALVIVIDNLDRVAPDEAISIWSTMRIFFEFGGQVRGNWDKRFWLIVPFDPSALKRLWGGEQQGSEELVTAFSNKTFQLTFHVSPPVLSDWKMFFRQQLETAFPKHQPRDDFDTIYRLFRFNGLPLDRPVTPRDIKLFVNQVGAHHRQWNDDIPLPLQALHVLYASKIHDPQKALVRSDLIDENVMNLLALSEWQKHLAALHYNVEPSKAIQILIGSQVEKSLITGNTEELQSLQEIPGFVDVCTSIVEENYLNWASQEPASLSLAAVAVASVRSSFDWRPVWHCLYLGVDKVESWKVITDTIGRGIADLLSRQAPEKSFTTKVLRSLAKTPPDSSPAAIGQWLDGVVHVLKLVLQRGEQLLVKENFKVPGTPGVYIEILNSIGEKGISPDMTEFFVPQVGHGEAMTELVSLTQGQRLEARYRFAIDTMTRMNIEWGWENLVSALHQRLQAGINPQPQEIEGCLGALILLARRNAVPVAQSTLAKLCNGGHIFHALYMTQGQQIHAGTALCLFAILDVIPAGNHQQNVGNSSAGHGVYASIISTPKSYEDVTRAFTRIVIELGSVEDLILKPAVAVNTEPFIGAILSEIAYRTDAHEYLKPAVVIENYALLMKLLPVEALNNLVSELVAKANLLFHLMERDFSQGLAGLYQLAVTTAAQKDGEGYTSFLIQSLHSLPKDVWLEELLQEGQVLELSLSLVEKGSALKLASSFQDGLIEHSRKVLDGHGLPTRLLDRWKNLPSMLGPEFKETFLRDLRDALTRNAEKNFDPVLQLYGEILLESNVLEEEADEIVRHLFTVILDRKGSNELDWLRRCITTRPEILKRCKPASTRMFRDRVKTTLKGLSETEASRSKIQEIAQALKINLAETSEAS